MQDKTAIGNPNNDRTPSKVFREYIESLVEEIVINNAVFNDHKKYLQRYSQEEGLDYATLEKNLTEFFETVEELKSKETKSSERLAKMLAKDCYLEESEVDKLVLAVNEAREKEAERIAAKQKAEEERIAALKKAEEERLAREKAEREAAEKARRRGVEEARRKATEEAERKAREERERIAREREAERLAKEKRERKAREEAERKAKEEAERKVSEEVEKEASFEEGVLHYYIINYHDNGKNEVEVSYSGDKQLCPKEIIIPPTVVHNGLTYTVSVISTYGFSELSNLGSITIPNTIEKIYDFAFYKCRSLRTIKMGESIKSIGDSAFHTCTSIEYLQLPPKIESIAPNTFSLCENIKTISIPDTVESIGAYAFNGTGLRELTIPKSVRFIGEYAFAYCKKLKHHKVENPNCKIEPHAFDNWNFFERLFV